MIKTVLTTKVDLKDKIYAKPTDAARGIVKPFGPVKLADTFCRIAA